jgi:CAAX prenyl protease-like protein
MNLDRDLVARILPFAVFIGFIALDGLLQDAASAMGMDARWWYGVRVVVVAGVLVWFWRRYEELHSIAGVRAADWLLSIAVGVGVFVLWINLNFSPLAFSGSGGFDPHSDGRMDWLLAVMRLAGAALLVPVMEELFWRSFVMRWIHKPDFLKVVPAEVGVKALAISSVLFALEHHLWFAGLLAGLAYGWLYRRSGNLWVPTLSHAVTNAALGIWVLYTGNWQFW